MSVVQLLDLIVREGEDARGLTFCVVRTDGRGDNSFGREFPADHLVRGSDGAPVRDKDRRRKEDRKAKCGRWVG